MVHKISCFSIMALALLSACQQPQAMLSAEIPEVDKNREAKMLTAFFGLDNALPPRAVRLYKRAPGQDGMPIVFSQELNPETMQASDFAVITMDGSSHQVEFATFLPANEEFELRTVLLIGEYGNHPNNPPVEVRIVGSLQSRHGIDHKGQSISVIPLPEGPILSYVEHFKLDDNYPLVKEGNGCDCPVETKVVVRAVWSGGVRALNGDELGESDLNQFLVQVMVKDDTLWMNPFQLADLGDNDNNIDLCLDRDCVPLVLKVAPNVAIDPNDDPNPPTTKEIISRW